MPRPRSSRETRARADARAALAEVSDVQLLNEVSRRNVLKCPCGKWPAYIGVYDERGSCLRCRGCLKAIEQCTCGYPTHDP